MEPDEYNSDFDSESLKPEDYSDIGEAKVLVREYGEEIKYSAATNFIRYDGKCWQEDAQLAIGAIEEFLDLQLCDAQDENPFCVKCYEEGHITMATVVDHIKPHRGDRKLFWDRGNWQPLCEHHHNVKTMTEDRYVEYKF